MRRRFLDALLVQGLAAALLACALPAARAADEMPVARVEFNDGAVNTRVIELPAKTRFLLEMVNNGKTPAEFESRSLGVEIVIPPGANLGAGQNAQFAQQAIALQIELSSVK